MSDGKVVSTIVETCWDYNNFILEEYTHEIWFDWYVHKVDTNDTFIIKSLEFKMYI